MRCAVPTIRAGTNAVCDEPSEIVTQSSRNYIERIRSPVTAKPYSQAIQPSHTAKPWMDDKPSSQAQNGKEIDFPVEVPTVCPQTSRFVTSTSFTR